MAEERSDKGRQGWGAGEPARVERGLGLNKIPRGTGRSDKTASRMELG